MKKLFIPFLLSAISFSLLTSCEKEELIYELTITITVDGEDKVQNALARVYAPVTGAVVDYYVRSDGNGEIFLEFKNKAVVEIIAQKGSYKACGFAEVARGRNRVTIDLKPFGSDENGCETSP